MFFEGGLVGGVDVVAEGFEDVLFEGLESVAVVGGIVGEDEGIIDAATLELGELGGVGGEFHFIGEGLADLGLAESDEAYGEGCPGGAGAEAFNEVGEEVIADHGLEFAWGPGEADDDGAVGHFEDESDGGAGGVFEVGAAGGG